MRTDNVIYFPAYLFDGQWFRHHGEKFRTIEDMADSLSRKDYSRAFAWECRRDAKREPQANTGDNAA